MTSSWHASGAANVASAAQLTFVYGVTQSLENLAESRMPITFEQRQATLEPNGALTGDDHGYDSVSSGFFFSRNDPFGSIFPGGYGGRVLIHSCGKTHGIRKTQSEEFDGQFGRAINGREP